MLKQPVAAGKVLTLVAESIGARGARIVWADGHRTGVQFIEGSAQVVGAIAHRAGARDSGRSAPPPLPAPQPAPGLNAQFMRGRARVLRGMAETTPDPEKAATLRRSAEAMEAEAAEIERRQRF